VEGSRSLLVEIQALVAPSHPGSARRTALGIDPQRVAMLVAVMERKLGLAMISPGVTKMLVAIVQWPLRALSGIPENALGSHFVYGANESFLLPRGVLGRADFEHSLDLHIGYRRQLNAKNMSLELFFDVFNVYDRQGTASVDDTYAPQQTLADTMGGTGAVAQNANPISGGTYEDLIWLKQINQAGNETGNPIGRNPNFGNPTVRYAPTSGRIGLRLTF